MIKCHYEVFSCVVGLLLSTSSAWAEVQFPGRMGPGIAVPIQVPCGLRRPNSNVASLSVTARAIDAFTVQITWTGRVGSDYTVAELGSAFRTSGHLAPLPTPGSKNTPSQRSAIVTHQGALPGSSHTYEIKQQMPDGTQQACGAASFTTPQPSPISVTGQYIDNHSVKVSFQSPSSVYTTRLYRPRRPVVEPYGADVTILYDIGRPGHFSSSVIATGQSVSMTIDPGPPSLPYLNGTYVKAPVDYPFILEAVWTDNQDGTGRSFSLRQPFTVPGPAPIVGYADLHAHMFAYLGFGGHPTNYPWGRHFWGQAYGTTADALKWCLDQHGPAGTWDLGQYMMHANINPPHTTPANTGHGVGGDPAFDGWPRWDSFTHQAYHMDWLKRAHDKGLKLIVTHPVNNEWMCTMLNHVTLADAIALILTGGLSTFVTAPNISYWAYNTDPDCLDKDTAEYQAKETLNMQDWIDNNVGDGRNSGPGTGWFRVVKSPAEARSVIAQGKLAVVIGMEVDNPFECTVENTGCNQIYIMNQLRHYYQDLHVRHFFPIHFYDNAFGGSANSNFLISNAKRNAMQKRDCDAEGYKYDMYRASDGYLHPQCNNRSLSTFGEDLIHELMNYGMMIDVDHMSAKSFESAMALVSPTTYPVISSHTGFTEIAMGDENNEGNRTPNQMQQIMAVGGLFAIIPHQGNLDQIKHFPPAAGHNDIPHNCGNSSETVAQAYRYAIAHNGGGPVGFGTDLNGFAGWPSPRFGSDACVGGGSSSQPKLSYPATIRASNVQIIVDQSIVGQKTFDFNTDGFAHIGMLPDMIADFQAMGMSPDELDPLFFSAEGYIRAWERADYMKFHN
jgi:microsomal dipeptidase-like Zn-dependent dipeptidase